MQAVTTLDFHPTVSVLASGSKDCTVKLFDYSKPSAKRAYNIIQEVAPVHCLHFHPSGDFMIVGTEQSTCMSDKIYTCTRVTFVFLVLIYIVICTLVESVGTNWMNIHILLNRHDMLCTVLYVMEPYQYAECCFKSVRGKL